MLEALQKAIMWYLTLAGFLVSVRDQLCCVHSLRNLQLWCHDTACLQGAGYVELWLARTCCRR